MVCRVIPAGCVSVDKGKCFVKKLIGHRGKPDAARRLIRRYMQNGHVQISGESGLHVLGGGNHFFGGKFFIVFCMNLSTFS